MPSNIRRVRVKKEKPTRRSWLDTVLQDTNSAAAPKRPSSSSSSSDPRSTLSNASPVSVVSESEADVVAFLTDAAIHRRQHFFEQERKHRKLPTPSKRDFDVLKHRMRPCDVGPLPNYGPQNPMLKREEELLSLHKRSLGNPKPSTAQWILPSPPPTAEHSLEDSSSTPDGRWLLPSPPLTADKATFPTTSTTSLQRQPSDYPRTPPPITPAAPATSNLRAIAPKKKKKAPLTIPTVGYEDVFKDTPRLMEEMQRRGQIHVEARRPVEHE